MARKTSIESYRALMDSGALGSMKLKVYDFVFNKGPVTAKQIYTAIQKQNQATGGITTILSEMRRDGLIEEAGTTVCNISGRRVILWDVTDKSYVDKVC